MRRIRTAICVAVLAALAGCSFDESLVEDRCFEEGATEDGRVCRDGTWVDASDVGVAEVGAGRGDAVDLGDAPGGLDAIVRATGDGACTDCSEGTCKSGPCSTCKSGATRKTDVACGYKNRGSFREVCSEGKWSRGKCVGVWYESCREYLEAHPKAKDGTYLLDPDGPEGEVSPRKFNCAMKAGGWTFVAVDNFEKPPSGWSGAEKRTTCGAWGKILGGHCVFGKQTIQKTFSIPPIPHTTTRLYLEFVKIDSWDVSADDRATVFLNNSSIWSAALDGNKGAEVCGYARPGHLEEKLPVSTDIADPGTRFQVRVTVDTDEPPCNESWGIDNVQLLVL